MIRFIFLFFLSLNLSAQTVYRTPSGQKYHLSTCRMVKNVSAKSTVETAAKDGLSPCKICKPSFRSTYDIVTSQKKHPEKERKIDATDSQKAERAASILRVSAINSAFNIYLK